MRVRASLFAVLLATLGIALGACGLNPQPEIPSDTDDDAGSGAAGAPALSVPDKHRAETPHGSDTSDMNRADPNYDQSATDTKTQGGGTPTADAGRPPYQRSDAGSPPPQQPPREAPPDGGTGSVTM